MSKPKQHRWVPRFYLDKFATTQTVGTDSPKVWRLDKDLQHDDLPTNVRNICTKNYLYAPKDEGGARDWSTESYLSEVEAAAGSVWADIDTDDPCLTSPEVRNPMATFVGLLHLRNYEHYKLIDSTIELRNKLFGAPSADKIASLKPQQLDYSDSGRYFSKMLVQHAERMAGIFTRKRWLVLHSSRDILITSDRPVVFLHGQRKKAGPGVPGVVAMLPLSPRRVLTMTERNEEVPEVGHALPDGLGLEINRALLDRCGRNIFTGRHVEHVIQELSRSVRNE